MMEYIIGSGKLCQPAESESPVLPGPGVACSAGIPATGPEGGSSLPSLYSNICTEEDSNSDRKARQIQALCGILSPYQKRQAHTLFANVARLIESAPHVGHIGFFTLTTKDVTDKDEFGRRWHSMRSHYWNESPHFGNWIGCFEQQKRGAWHLHLLVVLGYDIRTGVKFDEFEKRRYSSASPYLRAIWRDLRGACLRYGFGRHELMPVRTNADAMARYVGKYISKHIGQRDESAKGKRLVTSSQGWLKNSVRFAWNTQGAKEWRRKVKKFAGLLGCCNLEDLYERLGPGWAYKYLEVICSIDEMVEGQAAIIKDDLLLDAETGQVLF